MTENQRNIMVAIFVIIGLVVLGWLVFQFGDLPTFVSRYDAHEISIFLPEAPGLQENTPVKFRGYRVGKVVRVDPPELLPDLEDPKKKYYQIEIRVAISKEYHIPANVRPKVFRRGLGTGFVALVLEGPPSPEMIKAGDQFKGMVSEGSDFISEGTQRKLDQLITSLTELSDNLKSQLTPLPPTVVDNADPNKVHSNITTAVMRLDSALKNLNIVLGDVENQQNVKKTLVGFAGLSGDLQAAMSEIKSLAAEGKQLIGQAAKTIENIGEFTDKASTNVIQLSQKMRETAEQMAVTLDHLDSIIVTVSEGKGSVGRAFTDPRLYEALTDASENLSKTVEELRLLLEQWNKKGVKTKLF